MHVGSVDSRLSPCWISHASGYCQTAVKSVLDKVPRPNPFKNNLPGHKWLMLFLKRHPQTKLKNTEILSKTKASVTEKNLRAWFKSLKDYLVEENALDILNEPSRIYNPDETGVQQCPKTGKLLSAKKEKNVYYISPGKEKECITVLCTYSTDGKEISPMIVYPYLLKYSFKKVNEAELVHCLLNHYIILSELIY